MEGSGGGVDADEAPGKKVSFDGQGSAGAQIGPDGETPEDGIWEEVHETRGSLAEPMRTGGICFSWECGRHLQKVPYFVVPDAWAKDPALVERVAEGMKLKVPNMVVNFNPIKQPISRWNKEWDYWSPNADSIWEIDEDILPLDLPVGQPHTVQVV